MVRAGYLNPEEAEQINSSQPYDVRMDRAAQIFYEYCQDYAPELVAYQYEDFNKAAKQSKDARTQANEIVNLDEAHDKISLSSLSQSLIGLSKQA